jgi:nucleotide sugar dehydrogenase
MDKAAQATGSGRWHGVPGTTGTVAVVGLGKIGLPLAAQYASAGWRVIGVDVLPAVVDAVNEGLSLIQEEPELAERVAAARSAGLLRATTSHAKAAQEADVVVIIVPLTLTPDNNPDYTAVDAASGAVGQGLRPGCLVIYETTLPVGDTRNRFGPILRSASHLQSGGDGGFLLAFSPERVYSGRVFRDLATYPKLVGGIDLRSGALVKAFYESVLTAEVWHLESSEAAEFAKLAETTYRDVNIALANEFARYAETTGVDVLEVIRAANSQPFSHIHQPGIGVGGHCIPVYPHFLLSRASDLTLIKSARQINDDQVAIAVQALARSLGSLRSQDVLVLGLTYRDGVHELAYSRGVALVKELRATGAIVWACDPLLSPEEIQRCGAQPYEWGTESGARAVISQTADPLWSTLDFDCFPHLEVLLDGRNSLRDLARPAGLVYLGIGLAPRG